MVFKKRKVEDPVVNEGPDPNFPAYAPQPPEQQRPVVRTPPPRRAPVPQAPPNNQTPEGLAHEVFEEIMAQPDNEMYAEQFSVVLSLLLRRSIK